MIAFEDLEFYNNPFASFKFEAHDDSEKHERQFSHYYFRLAHACGESIQTTLHGQDINGPRHSTIDDHELYQTFNGNPMRTSLGRGTFILVRLVGNIGLFIINIFLVSTDSRIPIRKVHLPTRLT